MNGKEYMQRIKNLRLKIFIIEQKIVSNITEAEGVSAIRYDKDKVQVSPDGDRMTDIVAKIIELNEELYDQIDKLQKRLDEAQIFLEQLREEHTKVLVYYYFNNLSWEHIADKMGYNEKYIYELRDRALNELTEVLTKSERI